MAQNKSIKVLMQQIAALHVYIDYAKEGYSTVKKGLNVISDFKKGELNLHTDYFNSLRTVNPAVKNYVRVAEIIALQSKILQRYNNTWTVIISDSSLFNTDELDYIQRAFDRLLNDCEQILGELESVLTDGELEMKDDERIERIEMLYTNMMDNFTFCEVFGSEAKVLAMSRINEQIDVRTSRSLRGIN